MFLKYKDVNMIECCIQDCNLNIYILYIKLILYEMKSMLPYQIDCVYQFVFYWNSYCISVHLHTYQTMHSCLCYNYYTVIMNS